MGEWGATEIYRLIQRFHTGLNRRQEWRLACLISRQARQHSHDPVLVIAIIAVESSFCANATSPKGAKGLMQLRPFVARALAEELGMEWDDTTLYDPETNVTLGMYYLAKLMARFKDCELALTAYNAGPTDVQRRLREGKSLSRAYVAKVLANYRELSATHRSVSGSSVSSLPDPEPSGV
jgi:soluble lytic murein transglycosylase-like protein